MATKEHGIKQAPAGAQLLYDDTNDKFVLQRGTANGEKLVASGLAIPEHDYITIEHNSNYDVIGYYIGGSLGTQVAEITVTYTDTTKTDISTVERA